MPSADLTYALLRDVDARYKSLLYLLDTLTQSDILRNIWSTRTGHSALATSTRKGLLHE